MKHLLVPAVLGVLAAGCSGSSTHLAAPSATTAPSSTSTPAGPAPGSGAQTPVAAESNPPGDIPDNVAYIAFVSASGHYTFTHPEGWAETQHGTSVLLTDKLNGITADLGSATAPPTVASARQTDVPALQKSQAAFELRSVTAVTVPGGTGVHIVYRRNSAPDAVTGRQYRDEVERYELVSGGHEVVLEMFGPVGADNVDAYRTMVQSLRLR
jgi:hypothetical protein